MIARAYCLPRNTSSNSLSRWTIVAIEGATAAIRIVRTAIATTTPTRVKPGAFFLSSPVTVIRPVQRHVLGGAVDVDDPGLRRFDRSRLVGLGGFLLHREHPVLGLRHGVERDLPHVAVVDQGLEVR